MSELERILPAPRLLEVDEIDLAASPTTVWELIRHGDLGRSSLIRALFAVRELPARIAGHRPSGASIRIDDLVSTAERPGFQVLADRPPHEVVLGAIGKVWQPDIPFVHVADGAAFARFQEPGYVKVAWSMSIEPRGEHDSRLTVEVRVDATDEPALAKFRQYFRLIGPASRFIRRSALASFARELGRPNERERERPLPGDELLPDAQAALDHGITIAAPPEKIWPWLVQMGCRRAGFYSIDLFDNGGVLSAREVHPELQSLKVGDVLPATPHGEDGFEVLVLDPSRALVLGGLFDAEAKRQLQFAAPRPENFWHMTWAFVLEPLSANETRLHVRARGAFPDAGALHAAWIRPVHYMMETAQLRHLKARVEGNVPRDDARDVLEGLAGVARMALALATPFLRGARSHWGIDASTAARPLPGDELVPAPRWSWTHGIEIAASVADVWPWIAQIGATKGGFYSYQWLENVAGCEVSNAEVVHPEWQVNVGDPLYLHPQMPPLAVVACEPGRWFVAWGAPDVAARAEGKPWVAASWLFHLEPLAAHRCRLISRYRIVFSDEIASRLSFGPALLEPIGFAMDRRMLLGVQSRAEASTAARQRSA